MAEAAARREARRRRILENSENRLQKITGKYKENSTEENSENIKPSRPHPENGYAEAKCDSVLENNITTKEKHENLLGPDFSDTFNDQSFEQPKSNIEYNQLNDHFLTNHVDDYSSKDDTANYDNLNSHLKTNPPNQACEQSKFSWFFNLFFSSLLYVFLAAFVNILFVINTDFSFYKGIITPYLIISITRLCLKHESEESQANSMLVAALILCNIKPKVVHNFNKIWTISRTIFKDLALYLTSFVMFHWIISICWSDLSRLQFY